MYKFWQNRKDENALLELEANLLERFDPPIEVLGLTERAQTPIIFSSPHSGRIYPKDWLSLTQMSMNALRQAEDAYIDDLFSGVTALGAPLLRARFPRSFVDVNRAEAECPARWPSASDGPTPRALAGLGVVPLVIAQGRPIYKKEVQATLESRAGASIGEERLRVLYRPYHAALSELIERAKAEFGYAVLIECHSMPGFGPMNKRRPDMVLGDRFGRSCRADISAALEYDLRAFGYSLVRNHPYAGGYITQLYGQPDDNVHVVQIEINRDLYLSSVTMKTKSGFEPLRANIQAVAEKLINRHSAATDWRAAAE